MAATNAMMTTWSARRLLGGMLLVAAVCGVFAGCAGLPQGPTYTDAELAAICRRNGGWWRGDLIAGYCEFQFAAMP